jgi:hypothetical protein
MILDGIKYGSVCEHCCKGELQDAKTIAEAYDKFKILENENTN